MLEVFRDGLDEHPAMDIAASHALLQAVATGDMPASFRLHVPSPVVAFGRADRVNPGYSQAVRAAEAHGFTAVERLAGGRAAVFHEGTLAFSWAQPATEPRSGIRERFEEIAGIMATAFRHLGVDARVGELPGEYCPGQWSVNVSRRVKVMGVGQRLIRGATHLGGVVVVGESHRIRDVLIPVYRSLHLDWDPRTTGSLADVAPGLDNQRVAAAILAEMGNRYELTESTLPDFVIDMARSLIPDHIPAAT